MTVITIGSRESQLAMIQTVHVQSMLRERYPEHEFRIKGMTTTGDQVLEVALAKIGSKSLFTKELEVALASNQVDLVVHSLKDLPTDLPEGMTIAAVLEREDPRDAVVMSLKHGSSHSSLSSLPDGSIVGTSSVRRSAQLKRRFPNVISKDIRGNLNTRLRKLDDEDSQYDALVLAYAGVHRMGWTDRVSEILNVDTMLYAVGQGALAIECRQNDAFINGLVAPLTHHDTALRCFAERAFMRSLEGGCSVPLGVSTQLLDDTENRHSTNAEVEHSHSRTPTSNPQSTRSLVLIGSVTRLDGSHEIRDSVSMTIPDDSPASAIATAETLGRSVAAMLVEKGAKSILNEIRCVSPPLKEK